MQLFLLCVLVLILGYLTYTKFVEIVWGISKTRKTPAEKYSDGIDCVKMSPLKIFLVQFLNIAGLGPVFGALMGIIYGPACLLWIVFGTILMGSVHDFISGMMSLKFRGQSMGYIIDKLFGKITKNVFLIVLLFILILVGTVFAINPAKIMTTITPFDYQFWITVIFGYYFLSAFFPIDKIIGKIYPFFAVLLLVSTISLLIALCFKGENWFPVLTLENLNPSKTPMFPVMFITVACGAISGFHSTQSPIMAKCIPNEKYGKIIFAGAMYVEGLVALAWATLGSAFYHTPLALENALNLLGQGGVVAEISRGLLNNWGAFFTVLSVVVLSITSGDTAFRSARINLEELLNTNTKNVFKRLFFCALVLGAGIALSRCNINSIWIYFGCINQTLATIILWVSSVYLKRKKKFYWITFLPAVFMSVVCLTYVFYSKICFGLDIGLAKTIAGAITLVFVGIFFFKVNIGNHAKV